MKWTPADLADLEKLKSLIDECWMLDSGSQTISRMQRCVELATHLRKFSGGPSLLMKLEYEATSGKPYDT